VALPLEGRVAAVTGASSGIGRATALALAAEGAAVGLGGRRAERLEETAAAIRAAGGTALALPGDLGDDAEGFVSRCADELGRLDVLVNCAGALSAEAFDSSEPASWQAMLDVNVTAALRCTAAALPLMRAAGAGHVVFVSSVAARRPVPGWAVYCLTKAGISAFAEALRAELLPAGIRVTVIEPGFTETEMLAAPAVREVVGRLSEQRGTGLMAAEDVASAIVYALAQPGRLTVEEIVMRPFRRPR
jgi:NADP-dependent 3-hydroxy acid dehydrogenase YdfG